MEFNHVSVLLNECIDTLNINPNGVYVDGTLGGGGHSLEIVNRLSKKGRLIGIDQDINALKKAEQVLHHHMDRITLIHDNFSNIKQVLENLEVDKIDGMLLDLGVSSHQLDESSRGFSYMQDAKLDMRMNTNSGFSAYNIVNEYDEKKLTNIITEFGEERWAKRIAQFIVLERKNGVIQTTGELVTIIKKAVPKAARQDGPHPAKRTFQAIRIEVNGEIDILRRSINDIIDCLNAEGRVCIISFHSLEDRIIKNTFRNAFDPCTCPIDFPVCICGLKQKVRIITRKPILPSEDEIEANSRARSAKLRVAEKL